MLRWAEPLQLRAINRQLQQADAAFAQKKYGPARRHYEALLAQQELPQTGLSLNLAHACMALGDTACAGWHYRLLLEAPQRPVASVAAAQLGVLACLQGDSLLAETLFRKALTINPDNAPARHNYLLVHRNRRAGSSGQPQPAEPQHVQAAAVPPPAAPRLDTRREQFLKTLKSYNLDEARAHQLLDAMQASEIQFLQQRPRPPQKAVETRQKW